MHLTQESFYTLHLRKWEANQLGNEMQSLLDNAGVSIEEYPALNTLFGAIWFHAEESEGVPIVADEEIPKHQEVEQTDD